jgi:hypothetical protein
MLLENSSGEKKFMVCGKLSTVRISATRPPITSNKYNLMHNQNLSTKHFTDKHVDSMHNTEYRTVTNYHINTVRAKDMQSGTNLRIHITYVLYI